MIQAAAYGLPVVATQNGGPVDIIKALHNGLLVDPHDAAAITGALLSLLADKARWLECRRAGLRNIHRFSWPHHCRLYLAHIAANCDHPAPHQLLRVPASPRAASADGDSSLSDSLRGLSISIDTSNDLKPGAGADYSAAAIMDALRQRRAAGRPPASRRAGGRASSSSPPIATAPTASRTPSSWKAAAALSESEPAGAEVQFRVWKSLSVLDYPIHCYYQF